MRRAGWKEWPKASYAQGRVGDSANGVWNLSGGRKGKKRETVGRQSVRQAPGIRGC